MLLIKYSTICFFLKHLILHCLYIHSVHRYQCRVFQKLLQWKIPSIHISNYMVLSKYGMLFAIKAFLFSSNKQTEKGQWQRRGYVNFCNSSCNCVFGIRNVDASYFIHFTYPNIYYISVIAETNSQYVVTQIASKTMRKKCVCTFQSLCQYLSIHPFVCVVVQ